MNVIAKMTDIFVLIAVTLVSSVMLCGTLYERVSTVLIHQRLALFLEGVSDRGYIEAEDFSILQSSLSALDKDYKIAEFSLNRMMYEPEYVMMEKRKTENKYIYEVIETELPEVFDEPPVFLYEPENEAWEYNEAIKTRKHACSICEEGGLCEDIRDFRPLRDTEIVIKGSPLLQCAIILYADGSEKAVTCAIDTDSTECCKNKTVTLRYEVAGNILECIYSLDVLSDTELCTMGHVYYRKSVSMVSECPYCVQYPKYIEICSPCEPLDIKRGNSLASSGVVVRVFYMDGHEEILYSGYVDNLDKNYVGIQTVTVSYRGSSDVIVINNIPPEYICASCNRESNYPDGVESGLCEECILKSPCFTGRVLSYEKVFYTNDIMEKLYSEGIFYLKKEDFLKLEIRKEDEIVVYGTEIRGGED